MTGGWGKWKQLYIVTVYLEESTIVLCYHGDEWYANQCDHCELPGELEHEDDGSNKLNHIPGREEEDRLTHTHTHTHTHFLHTSLGSISSHTSLYKLAAAANSFRLGPSMILWGRA